MPCSTNRNFKCLAGIVVITVVAIASSASAQEFDATALVERMSAEIAQLDRFAIQGDAYTDARLDAGQIIEHASQVEMRVRRSPAAVRISNRDAQRTNEIYFNDGRLSVYNDHDNFYAQTEIPKSVDSMFDYAVNDVGIEAPLLDFVSSNIASDLTDRADEVRYLGTSLIRGEVFHHIGIRSSDVDIQLWIASEGKPLPGKLAITSKWEGGSPRFVAFFHWDTTPTFSPDLFRFVPPDNAVEIDFIVNLKDQGVEQ